MRFVFVLIAFFCCFDLFAQPSTDQQLANLYYTNGEYEKAVMYYEKIIQKQSPKFEVLRYVECLEKTNQIKEAEKILKKQVAANEADVEYRIILGDFYERNDRKEQAEKLFGELIKSVSGNGYEAVELYNNFVRRGKVEWGLKTLEAARKQLKKDYPLQLQFAEAYSLLGRTEDMIDEYFNVIDEFPNYAPQVQTALSKQIDFQEDVNGVYGKLKDKLLQRIQKKPNETVYAEMLIWLFIQKKEFKSALIQAQALDKREKGYGQRVLDLAETCSENQAYDVARSAYNYVMSYGKQSPLYYMAYSSLLNVHYREIVLEKKGNPTAIQTAIQEYRQALNESGLNRTSVGMARELATIQAYYADQAPQAAQLLDSCLNVAGLTDMQRAEIKMSLADILVLQDDIWQASLYYKQIDTDFKFEAIGSEAKFKDARIFYYDGDFKFAQSQLDILKESTTKLIANDAMKLSVLITDNLGLDSNYTAMYWFAQADLLIEQHKFSAAFNLFDSIQSQFPAHGLADEMLFRRATAMEYQGRWTEAINYLEQILKSYGDDILADDAVFKIAEIYEYHLLNKEKAADYYKKILFEYKGSLLTVEARKRFRTLRGDQGLEDDL